VYLCKEFTLLSILVITQGSDLAVTLGKRASSVFELPYVPAKLAVTLCKRASNVFELPHLFSKLPVTLDGGASQAVDLPVTFSDVVSKALRLGQHVIQSINQRIALCVLRLLQLSTSPPEMIAHVLIEWIWGTRKMSR